MDLVYRSPLEPDRRDVLSKANRLSDAAHSFLEELGFGTLADKELWLEHC